MKLLFDNNLSTKLPQVINSYFPDSKHVFDLNSEHSDDREIWEIAKNNHFTIVTKDKDFYYLATALGHPPKVIWLTIGNCKNSVIANTILNNIDIINEFLLSKQDIIILS